MPNILKTFFDVVHIKNQNKRRFGPNQDSGYVMMDNIFDASHILGYGIGGTATFENMVCETYGINGVIFDHTISHPPYIVPNITYIHEGISDKKEPLLDTMTNHIEKYIPNGKNVIVKMDIEGDEWKVFANIDDETLKRVNQLILEVHFVFTEKDNELIIRTLKKLQDHFYLYHIHGNNYSDLIEVDSMLVPDVLELSYVRKDLIDPQYVEKATKEMYPSPFDYPNNKEKNDYSMDYFLS